MEVVIFTCARGVGDEGDTSGEHGNEVKKSGDFSWSIPSIKL